MDQVEQMRLASLKPAQRAAELIQNGDQFFQRGLVLEAEREYREALEADRSSALAHAGWLQCGSVTAMRMRLARRRMRQSS